MTAFVGFVIYILTLALILFLFRKHLKIDKFWQVFYIALIRTRIGISLMSRFSRLFSRLLLRLSYFSVFFGFVGMFFVSFDILRGVYNILSKSSTMTVGLVLPFEVKGAFYVPFAYWLISVIFVMVVHEFAHGVFARLHKIRVKSSGFAVLGAFVPLIPGAFVDIDEKQMSKSSLFAQLSVLSAGPFVNIVFGAVFLILMLFANNLFIPSGVTIFSVVDNSPAQITGLAAGELIESIDGKRVMTTADFSNAFDGKHSGDKIVVNDKKITLAKDAFLGVFVEQNLALNQKYADYNVVASILLWLKELFFWLFAINLGVGVFNLLPLGFLDGGRMFGALICTFLHRNRARHIVTSINATFAIALMISLIYSVILPHL